MQKLPYIRLRRDTKESLSKQISEQLSSSIRSRFFNTGDKLPGVRNLARHLNVSLETVQAAYHHLQLEGWVESRPHHGTVVIADVSSSPIALPRAAAERRRQFADRFRDHSSPGIIPVSGGTRQMDAGLQKAMEQFASDAVRAATGQGSADPFGLPALRSAIQGWLTNFGVFAEVNQMCVVTGTQQALYMVGSTVVQPGTTVFVPDMCYLAAREVFREFQGHVRTLPMTPQGLDLSPLREALQHEMVSMVYATANGHYPTGWSMTAQQKQELLALAEEHGFTIVEDDYYAGIYYSEEPPLPLAALAPPEVSLYYICSFSNITDTSYRLGVLIAPKSDVPPLSRKKYLLDTHTSSVMQYLLLYAWESGAMERAYEEQRRQHGEALRLAVRSLEKHLSGLCRWTPPVCGMSMWVNTYVPLGVPFFEACLNEHVLAKPAEAFSDEAVPHPGFQVSFGAVSPEMLDAGLQRISKVLRRLR